MKLDGSGDPDLILEVPDRNATVSSSSDQTHLYVRNPGVCEVR